MKTEVGQPDTGHHNSVPVGGELGLCGSETEKTTDRVELSVQAKIQSRTVVLDKVIEDGSRR